MDCMKRYKKSIFASRSFLLLHYPGFNILTARYFACCEKLIVWIMYVYFLNDFCAPFINVIFSVLFLQLLLLTFTTMCQMN